MEKFTIVSLQEFRPRGSFTQGTCSYIWNIVSTWFFFLVNVCACPTIMNKSSYALSRVTDHLSVKCLAESVHASG